MKQFFKRDCGFFCQANQFDRHTEICLDCKVNTIQTYIFIKKIKDLHEKEDDFDDSIKEENDMDEVELISIEKRKEDGETSDDSDLEGASGLSLHKISDSSNDSKENTIRELSGPGDLITDILNESTMSSNQMCKIFIDLLQNHRNNDINEKLKNSGKFTCTMCLKGFTSEYHLKNHIKFVHLKKYDHVCKVCQRAYHNRYILDKHKCRGSD